MNFRGRVVSGTVFVQVCGISTYPLLKKGKCSTWIYHVNGPPTKAVNGYLILQKVQSTWIYTNQESRLFRNLVALLCFIFENDTMKISDTPTIRTPWLFSGIRVGFLVPIVFRGKNCYQVWVRLFQSNHLLSENVGYRKLVWWLHMTGWNSTV